MPVRSSSTSPSTRACSEPVKVVGFSGYSGAGKTTLLEQVIALLRASAQRVSVIKHAHHGFDIDREGKDSWRHRQAGAGEILIASSRRLALMRENPVPADPDVHELLAMLSDCDWVLVEGFRRSDLPKIEVWRAETGHEAHYPVDAHIVAIATDDAGRLPAPTTLPVLDINDPAAIVAFLNQSPERYEYHRPDAR